MHGGIGIKLCLWAALVSAVMLYVPVTAVQFYDVWAGDAIPSLVEANLSKGWLTTEQQGADTVIRLHNADGTMVFNCRSALTPNDSCLGNELTTETADEHKGMVWWHERHGLFSQTGKRLLRLDVDNTTIISRAAVVQAANTGSSIQGWLLWGMLTLILALPLAYFQGTYRAHLKRSEPGEPAPG